MTKNYALLLAVLSSLLGCTVGEGRGSVQSERLYIEECWNGPFNLQPDFFGANPYRGETLLIRVQRGDNLEEQSDGMVVLVNDLQELRARTNEVIEVGLPAGVSPPGVPIAPGVPKRSVSLALYLHNTCHAQNATVYSVSGQIVFRSLFSGNLAESSAENRLTDADFSAVFADPRQLTGDASSDEAVSSTVTGNFKFFFQRGQPAQPFQ
jgi:hypothetical protein